jgi:hypothetical protein
VDSAANFLSLNMTDNWTMMVGGVLMIAAGWMFSRHTAEDRK